MSEEKMKILEMLKEGKITAEEAHRLLEDLEEGETVEVGGEKPVKIKKSGKDKPKGLFAWFNKILFAFIPILLVFGLLGFIAYGLFYYLPTYSSFQVVLIVYGLIAVIILCITLVAYGLLVGVGRDAIRGAFKHKYDLAELVKLKRITDAGKESPKPDEEDDDEDDD